MELLFIISLIFFFSTPIVGQIEVGVSYELRDENPQNGFGLRIEAPFLTQVPVINLGVRLHLSYFNDENELTQQGIRYSEEITNYDVGLQAIAGLSVGLVEPYVGLGIGTERLQIEPFDFGNGVFDLLLSDKNDDNLYWNASVGAKVSIIPILKPFIEYRYTNTELGTPRFEQFDSKTGRMIFGVAIRL
ncbi:MAG: porin family protein [Bacteroidetes bacterium]|nr:porin family protein [Bacteroidota bacterium]